MADAVLDALVVFFCCAGILFFLGGTVGLLRCPDLYSRLHPSTKCDTLGACSVALALLLMAGPSFVALKLLAVLFFMMLSSAVCGHAIGRSAFRSGVTPWHKPGVVPVPTEEEP